MRSLDWREEEEETPWGTPGQGDEGLTDDNSSTTSSSDLQESDTRLIDQKFRKLYDSDPEFYENFGW